MKKIHDLKDWQLDKAIPNSERIVDVSVSIKYPDPKQYIEFKPKERINKIDHYHNESLKELLRLNLFDDYEIIGTKRKPRGVKMRTKFSSLNILNKLDFVCGVTIKNIDHAKLVKKEEQPLKLNQYFCVKMTVVIDFEGISSKRQKIEQRFVLIKADSFDDAYEKLEKQKDSYAEPYLNSDGRFVRWRIESFDDCYETDINSPKDLDNPEGVEIYSKFKSRKTKTETVWDGKF
jgi:hypothetical protein